MQIQTRMPNTTHLFTADELERMPEDDYRYELVRGRLICMSPGAPRHGWVTMALGALLLQHVKARGLGQVWTEVGFRLAERPDTVRAPDVAFVRRDRLPPRDARGFFRGAPDLAIEVLSPDDHQSDIREKVRDYLTAGTQMVVVVDPEAQRAILHRPVDASLAVESSAVSAVSPVSNDVLDLSDVVSDCRLPLSDVFE